MLSTALRCGRSRLPYAIRSMAFVTPLEGSPLASDVTSVENFLLLFSFVLEPFCSQSTSVLFQIKCLINLVFSRVNVNFTTVDGDRITVPGRVGQNLLQARFRLHIFTLNAVYVIITFLGAAPSCLLCRLCIRNARWRESTGCRCRVVTMKRHCQIRSSTPIHGQKMSSTLVDKSLGLVGHSVFFCCSCDVHTRVLRSPTSLSSRSSHIDNRPCHSELARDYSSAMVRQVTCCNARRAKNVRRRGGFGPSERPDAIVCGGLVCMQLFRVCTDSITSRFVALAWGVKFDSRKNWMAYKFF